MPFSVQSKVDTEYSDPFDAQPHPPPLDDGYMEPYDAQRVMSGELAGLGGKVTGFQVGVGADQYPWPPRTAMQEGAAV